MQRVYRCGQIDGHLTVPPDYGGRLDDYNNSILDDGRQELPAAGGNKMSYSDVRQARDDMGTPEQALAELQAAEREMYWESDKDRADKVDNALQDCRARQDNATSEDEALEALQDYEANLYLKEDN